MNSLLSSWFVELTLVTLRSFRGGNNGQHGVRPPLPSEIAAVMLVYGALGLVPPQGQKVAGLVGWGLVVATFLNLNWQNLGQGANPPGGESVPVIPPYPSGPTQPGRSRLVPGPIPGTTTIAGG